MANINKDNEVCYGMCTDCDGEEEAWNSIQRWSDEIY